MMTSIRTLLLCVLLAWPGLQAKADSTWVYSVQITAAVQASPARITLTWLPDQYGANSYTVYRKAKTDSTWGSGTTLSGTTTTYVDNNVTVGTTYEYQI